MAVVRREMDNDHTSLSIFKELAHLVFERTPPRRHVKAGAGSNPTAGTGHHMPSFLLRHEPINGPFAIVLSETQKNKKKKVDNTNKYV
jgi:hypothetical protein